MRALRMQCAIAIVLLGGLGCASGPSREELERDVREQREKLTDLQQQRDDLRVHFRTVDARNRVLIGLVKGLTASATEMADGGPVLVVTPAREQLDAIDRDLADLAGSLRKSRDAFVQLRTERAALTSQLDDAVRKIEEIQKHEAQALARSALFRDMLARLRSLGTARLEVLVVRNRMLLELPEALLFEPKKADVTRHGQAVLDEVATLIAQIPDRELEIAAHADGTPIRTARFPSSWHLSATRAVNVAQYLIAHGIPAERLSASGYADTRPIATGHDELSRRMNGRIEIVILPKSDELPDLSELNAPVLRVAPAQR